MDYWDNQRLLQEDLLDAFAITPLYKNREIRIPPSKVKVVRQTKREGWIAVISRITDPPGYDRRGLSSTSTDQEPVETHGFLEK
jgi:hypothetical protein